MSIFKDLPPEFAKAIPGVVGAIVSLWFLKEPDKSVLRRLGAFGVGCAISYFATPWLTNFTGMPEGLTGFLAGLTGLLFVSKFMETVAAFDALGILVEWARLKLRMPPANKKEGERS